MSQRQFVLGGLVALGMGLFNGVLAPVAHADSTTGDIFYTVYDGIDRIFQRSYSFDGTTLTYGSDTTIASTPPTGSLGGADGLVFDPTDPNNFLLVGGQNANIYW